MNDGDVDETTIVDDEAVNPDPPVVTNDPPREWVEPQLKLKDHVSLQHLHGRDIDYLDLKRSFKLSDTIGELKDNESVGGVCLSHNYLFQSPAFVSEYTNLIDVDVSHNELYEAEFLLYKPLEYDRPTKQQHTAEVNQCLSDLRKFSFPHC